MLNCKNLISKAAPDELETGETGAENTKLFKVHSRLITRQDRETVTSFASGELERKGRDWLVVWPLSLCNKGRCMSTVGITFATVFFWL